MGLFENFPYTDFHRLNLDWILKFTKSVKNRLDDIDAAVLAAINAQHSAEDAADTAERAADDAVNAKDLAMGAADDAEDAKDAAVSAKNDAQDAKIDAVNAKDDAISARNDAISARNDAQDAKDDAVSAASDAEDYATAAAGSAATAGDAEAWAVGTKNGVPVPSTAEQYENSAKYWAQQAGQSPALNVYDLTHEYTDSLALGYTNWGYRYATADDDGVVFISLSEQESNSEHVGELAVAIGRMVSGNYVEYEAAEEIGTDDPTKIIGVDCAAFMKVQAGDVIRLGAYRHGYLTGTPTMIADTNIIAIGTTLTLDAAFV